VYDALKLEEGERRAKIFAVNKEGIRCYKCDTLRHRLDQMAKQTNTHGARGGAVRRKAETLRVSINSARNNLVPEMRERIRSTFL
jgi:hypothetical protein